MFKALLCLFLVSAPCRAEDAPKPDFPIKLSIELEDVTPSAVNAIVSKLDEIEKVGTTQEIWLRLNSYGGDVEAGQKLISRLEQVQIPVTCVADFKAMSMAALILESPGCKTRLMTERTVLMFHHASVGGVSGNSDVLLMFLNWLTRLDSSMAKMCAKRMGMTLEAFEAKSSKTWFLDVDEAKVYRAIDDVVDSQKIPLPIKLDEQKSPLWFL